MPTHDEDRTLLDVEDPRYQAHMAEGSQRMAPFRDLVGRVFLHPTTQRLHEVVHIYWDPKERKVEAP